MSDARYRTHPTPDTLPPGIPAAVDGRSTVLPGVPGTPDTPDMPEGVFATAPVRVQEDLAAVAQATEHLLRTVADLRPSALAEPCALPGWTRGHLLAHLSRNADSLVNLLTGARTGRHLPGYADENAREQGIQDGARRPLEEQLADLRASAERLAEAASAMPADAWGFELRHRRGYTFPASELPWKRLGEVEYHHVDLDAGYTPAHWPASFATRELARIASDLTGAPDVPPILLRTEAGGPGLLTGRPAAVPELTVEGPVRGLVAWLSGRSTGDGLHVDPHGPLPPLSPMA
jgi:maleylpyruvate isomerase